MDCPECGAFNSRLDEFCDECGRELEAHRRRPSVTAPVTRTAVQSRKVGLFEVPSIVTRAQAMTSQAPHYRDAAKGRVDLKRANALLHRAAFCIAYMMFCFPVAYFAGARVRDEALAELETMVSQTNDRRDVTPLIQAFWIAHVCSWLALIQMFLYVGCFIVLTIASLLGG